MFSPVPTQLHPPLTAAILAGGKSLRMGRDKAGILIDGVSLLTRQIGLVRAVGADELLVSLRPGLNPVKPLPSQARIVRDRHPDSGPLSGVEACLEASQNDLVLMLAVDLPAMTPEYLRALLAMARTGQGVIAELGNQFEPLASLYPKASLAVARQHLDANRLSLQSLAARCLEENLAVRWEVPPHLANCLVNWNVPSDWTPPRSETHGH